MNNFGNKYGDVRTSRMQLMPLNCTLRNGKNGKFYVIFIFYYDKIIVKPWIFCILKTNLLLEKESGSSILV